MKIYLDCIPCFLRQALEAARWATKDAQKQRTVLDEVAVLIPGLPIDATPIDMGRVIHRTVREVTETDDPYREVKRQCNDRALALSCQFCKRVDASSDPLLAALKLAAASNVIDFAVDSNFNLERSIKESLGDACQVKCPVVARELGVEIGEIILHTQKDWGKIAK